MSRPWTGKKGPSSHRRRVSRETLELAITAAVKESDPQCGPFVGVLIEHHAPRSREDTNWAIKGIRLEGPITTSAARPWSPSSMKCRARLNFVRTLLPPGRLFAAGADDQVDRDARDHALRLGASGRGAARAPVHAGK